MKMATKEATLVHVNEDYIDMELTSYSREFEFQMTPSVSSDKLDSTTSPADDLFYKGKLLPLHLPPRLQMVQNLIKGGPVHETPTTSWNLGRSTDVRSLTPASAEIQNLMEDSKCASKSFPSLEDSNFVESCNISPSESCRVSSSEGNPDECLFGGPYSWSSISCNNNNNKNGFVVVACEIPNKSSSSCSWPKKLKQIKQFWLGQRVKSSSAYLKSLFTKSSCSDKSCCVGEEKKKSKYLKVARKLNSNNNSTTFEIFDDGSSENNNCNDFSVHHRRSFSGVVQRHCSAGKSPSSILLSSSTSSSGSSSSSSSFSFSSAGYYDLQLFKRSISANSEVVEGSIEGAIAHCKKSQFASKVAVCGNQEIEAHATTRG